MSDEKKIFLEDQVDYDGNGSRYDWMQKSQPITVSLLDVLKMQKKDWGRVKALLPYEAEPLREKLIMQGEGLLELRTDFYNIADNPLIRNDPEKLKVIKTQISRLDGMNEIYKNIALDIEKLRFDD